MNTKQLTAIILTFWAVAQIAVIDHVYSETHNDDNICEYCLSHAKLVTYSVPTTLAPNALDSLDESPSTLTSLSDASRTPFLLPLNRAPPAPAPLI